jgi:hypothetical protein
MMMMMTMTIIIMMVMTIIIIMIVVVVVIMIMIIMTTPPPTFEVLDQNRLSETTLPIEALYLWKKLSQLMSSPLTLLVLEPSDITARDDCIILQNVGNC